MGNNPASLFPALPDDFISSLSKIFPDRVSEIVKSLNSSPAVSVRLNRRKICNEFDGLEKVKWCDSGCYLPDRPSFTLNPLFHAGTFYVQEASSMIYQYIISKIANHPVSLLDLCGAPGGKTTAAINALPDGSCVVANEFVASRANILAENLAKWGFPSAIVTNSPTENFGKLKEQFDIIITDVPCSGEGMMRKEAVARSQWSEKLINDCSLLQREILAGAIDSLKPGGFLIYSTCTFNISENEENVKWLCDNFDFQTVALPLPEEWQITPSLYPDFHAMRFIPDRTRGEGLFVALLKKNGDSTASLSKKLKKTKNFYKDSGIKRFIKSPENYKFIIEKDKIYALSEPLLHLFEMMEDIRGIKILSKGIEMASVKGKDIVPSPALALSTELNPESFPIVELSLSEALSFLRRENLILDSNVPKGYVIASYKGSPIGFLKNLGNRANNLYPQYWRIRH